MAKFEIINTQVNQVKESVTPQTSALALPLSLAKQQGQAINSVVKVVKDITDENRKERNELEVDNAILPITKVINESYTKNSKLSDLDVAYKNFVTETNDKNFETILKGKSQNVQKLLKSAIRKDRIKKISSLVSAVNSNFLQENFNNIDSKIDKSIFDQLSSDAKTVIYGKNDFDAALNNPSIDKYLGPKKAADYRKKKRKQLLEAQTDRTNKISPITNIKNKKELIKKFGETGGQAIYEKALLNLKSNLKQEEDKKVLEEIKEQDNQITTFSDLLTRINLSKSDEAYHQDIPAHTDIYDAYAEGLINRPMFEVLTNQLNGKEQLTNEQVYDEINLQIIAAASYADLDTIKRAIHNDPEIMKNISLADYESINGVLDKAKKDFPGFQDYQYYDKLINANLKNLDQIGPKRIRGARDFESQKQRIKRAYKTYVNDFGLTPEQAYLRVLEKDFDSKLVPQLNTLVMPGTTKVEALKIAVQKNGADKTFKSMQMSALENYKKDKSAIGLAAYMEDMRRIDTLINIYNVRKSIGGEKFALEFSKVRTLEDLK